MKSILTLWTAMLLCATAAPDKPTVIKGFVLNNLQVDLKDIKSPSVPRDGIPAINEPKFIQPDQAEFMKDDDLVLSFTEGKITRAYPLRILVWHEIVNETIGNKPILVTYCPLCGTAMIFDRKVAGKIRSFGVSGLLYQSDVLMYDREDESLWSQLKMEAISGPHSGTSLKLLDSEHLTWKSWKEKYPNGQVLSTDTGYQRNYLKDAYRAYFNNDKLAYPAPYTRTELAKKDKVLGIITPDGPVAFSLTDLSKSKKATHHGIQITYDPSSHLATATHTDGKTLPIVSSYWFAWQAFHPKTKIWKAAP